MVVVGQTTAALATTAYVPPYQYVTSAAPPVSVTGTITSEYSAEGRAVRCRARSASVL
jgi:hypothetical protein